MIQSTNVKYIILFYWKEPTSNKSIIDLSEGSEDPR